MKEYPDFCKECSKKDTCKQKYFMLAETEAVEGFVDFFACDYYCEDCLDKQNSFESLCNSKSDHPVHCAKCECPLICPLTSDGIEYVKECLDGSKHSRCCRELWPTLFAEYLE